MLLYIILLILTVLIPFLVNTGISLFYDHYPVWYNLVASISVFVIIFTLDAIIATIIHRLPEKHFNYQKRIYTVSKKEKKRLEKIGIKKWKDKIPEMGQLCNFKKDKLESTDINYLEKFLTETCYAETIHISMALIGFLAIVIWPLKDVFYFTLPMAIINVFLNLPSILIQRYNRPRLITLYKYSQR